MQADEYVEETRKKIGRIPDFEKSAVESLLGIVPYLQGKDRERVMGSIDSIVNPRYVSHMLKSKNPVMSFPSRKEAKGNGPRLGTVMAGDRELYPFELTAENATESIVVTARSGHGKTSFVLYFVRSLIDLNLNFVFWDWKRDYRSVAKLHPDILVLKWSDIRFNPLTNVPPGLDTKMWWRVVFTIFSHSFGVLVATPSFLLEKLEELYEEKHGLVTFKDLHQYLKGMGETSRKRAEYLDVAENRIYTLNQALDQVVNVKHGYPVSDLFSGKVIIELDPLDTPIASFLVQTLLMHEFYRRLANQIRVDQKSTSASQFNPSFVLNIMDEGHNLGYRGFEESLVSTEHSPPVLTQYFSQCRELLMSNLVLTQFPDLLMKAILSNAGTKLVGNITETDNQKYMASSIGLDIDDWKTLGKLQKGTWIASVAGRTKPFVLKVQYVAKDLVGDHDVLERSKPMLTALQMKQAEIESRMFLSQVDRTVEKTHLPEISKEAWLLLDHIFNHEWHYQQQITTALGFSDRMMAKAKKMLLDKNLIRIEKFPVKVHDRIHFVLTGNALEVMKTIGKNPQRIGYWKWITGVPGYEHHYWQNVLRAKHRILGWTGRLEHSLTNGRRVDCYEEKDGFRKAIEIELSTNDIENKLRALSDGEVDELVLLYKEDSVFQLVRAKLERIEVARKDRIWVGLMRDYIDVLDNIIITHAETSGNNGISGRDPHEAGQKRKLHGDMEDKG